MDRYSFVGRYLKLVFAAVIMAIRIRAWRLGPSLPNIYRDWRGVVAFVVALASFVGFLVFGLRVMGSESSPWDTAGLMISLIVGMSAGFVLGLKADELDGARAPSVYFINDAGKRVHVESMTPIEATRVLPVFRAQLADAESELAELRVPRLRGPRRQRRIWKLAARIKALDKGISLAVERARRHGAVVPPLTIQPTHDVPLRTEDQSP